MLRAATAVRVLPWTQLRVCRPYNCTSVLLQQQLPSNPTTNSIKVKDGEEEKKAVTDGNLDEKLKKIQVFGSENQMNKVSNLLFKVRDIDALLTASIQQLKRHDEQYLKSKGPAFLYIADSLLKDRSPVLHRLLPMIEKSEPAIKLFGSKRLLQASKIFAYDLKLTEDTLTTEDRKYALSNTLFRPTDYKHRKAYKAALNFPNEAFLSFFSIKNKYDTDFLHLHLATRHFVRWLRATKVEELRLKLRLNSFFDLIQDKYQYDPTLTTAILLHNIREFTEADDANKALRRYPNIIFFTACSWLIKHGITQDLHRLYAFVKQFPEFAHPNSVPHDIYSDAIISMFEHFSKSTLSAASSSSSTTTRELSAAEIQQAKLMASFGKHNSFKAAKLRGAFFQTSNSFGYYNLSKLLLQEYYSEYVWLGTMVLNNCIRTFISVGDYATSKELVTMASDEKKLVKLLSSKLAMAENIQKANATEAKEGDSNDVDHTTDSNMLIAEANPLEGLVAIPPTELDVGINVSTLSSYITGLEHYYLAKENATNGLLPTAFVQVTEDFETQASNQILDLLHQMEEYKIIPYISLFKRILALNRSHLHNLTIPHMCIKLALRPGKIQPSDLKSTAVKQWKSRGHRHGDDVEKQMQVIDGKASVPSSFDPNVSSSSSSDGNSLAELMSTSDSQAQLNQALVLLELLEEASQDYYRYNQINNIKFVMNKTLALGIKPSENLVKTAMYAFLAHGKYEDVIDLFESLPQRKVPRTFDHATMVIEALAKQGRLHDAWRSISALKGPIMNSMNQIYREHQSSTSQDKILHKKTKYLLTQCEQSLHQIAFVAQTSATNSMNLSSKEVDIGKVKISREDLLASILFSIDMILRAYAQSTWDVNNVRTNQDQLAVKLYQFSRSNDPVVVNIVFSKIKGLGQRAEDLIDYVSSIEMVTDARSSILQNHM